MVKISTVLDAEPEIGDRPGAEPIAADRGPHRPGRRHASPTARPRCCTASTSTCRPAAASRWSARPAAASRRWPSWSPGSTTRREGTVRVDGVDLREVQLRSYRRQLGVVLQDPFLFSGTIADNIRFGRPEASDEDVRRHGGRDRRRPAGRPAARRARARGPRGRRGALGRRAPADLDRPGAARRSAHPDPRRGDVEHRPADRGADRAGARHGCCTGAARSSSPTGWRPSAAPTQILVVERGNIVQAGSERELLAVDGSFQRLAGKLHSPTARLRGRPGRGPGRRRPAQPDAV